MIPPLPAVRLRTIRTYLKDRKKQTDPIRLRSIDRRMITRFEALESSLKDSMMRRGTWGTAEGMQQINLRRLELWHAVMEEFLPTTDLDQKPSTEKVLGFRRPSAIWI